MRTAEKCLDRIYSRTETEDEFVQNTFLASPEKQFEVAIPSFVNYSHHGLIFVYIWDKSLTVRCYQDDTFAFECRYSNDLSYPLQSRHYKYELETNYTEVREISDQIAKHTFYYFGGVQLLSHNRPEVLLSTPKKIVAEKTVKEKGRYKNKKVIKMIRVIHLDNKELAKTHHTITCECWNVAGHWRTYKSGKKVFIKSYRKGKKKDDPNAVVPKTYELPSEDAGGRKKT